MILKFTSYFLLIIGFNLNCFSQKDTIDINNLRLNENWICRSDSSCCERGLILGEEPIPIKLNRASFDKRTGTLSVKGTCSEPLEYFTIILGERLEAEKMCPLKSLTMTEIDSNEFTISCMIEKENQILYIRGFAHEVQVFEVGKLIK